MKFLFFSRSGFIFISFLTLCALVAEVFFPFAVAAQTKITRTEAEAKIQELRVSLQLAPNYLQYTTYKMLRHKFPKTPSSQQSGLYSYYDGSYYEDYALRPYGVSALSLEASGGLSANAYFAYGGLGQSIDLLTGSRAIDESLQLGSIGAGQGNIQPQADRSTVAVALELYFDAHGRYPDRLEQLVPTYLAQLPRGFSYRRSGSSYELTFDVSKKGSLTIADVQPLELKSHPWEGMTKGSPSIPQIFSLVPRDSFMVYARNVDSFTQFEAAIAKAARPTERVYGLKDTTALKKKLFDRLGVRDIPELRKFIEEAVFVSYDLSFYPNTDYALILKLKSSLLDQFVADYVQAPQSRHGKVGDYYVIATHEDFYKRIAELKQDSSLFKAPDLAYILSVLEKDYDGFIFLSEDFIRKLTSPAYRINARRRNTTLQALETLQYFTFAYRVIAGQWPKTVQQMIAERYVQPNAVANISDYRIDEKGVVHHNAWGNIYEMTPLSRTPVTAVLSQEKATYENFREGYQRYWREFIDPVGIAVLVGDQIRFHTIILPLIDESQYNWLKRVAGGEAKSFDFLTDPDRLSSLQVTAKFQVDDILEAYYQNIGYQYEEDYKKCRENYYRTYDYRSSSRPYKSLSETCPKPQKNKEEAIGAAKKQLTDWIEWKEPVDVLGFLGDELTLAAGEKVEFKINDLSNFDISFGLALRDTELAQKFLEHVFRKIGKEFRSYNSYGRGDIFGFFSLKSDQPLKNTYNGVDFYIVPTGFTNLYYTFINNRFYATLSQSAINQLIDGSTSRKTAWPDYMERLLDYLGEKHNVLFLADVVKLQDWIKGLIREQWSSYTGGSDFLWNLSYYLETLALAKTLPAYDGTAVNTGLYYHYLPSRWFSAELFAEGGVPRMKVGGETYDMRKVDTERRLYSYYEERAGLSKPSYDVKLADIVKKFNVDEVFQEWGALKDFGIGLTFTEDGLDIRIAFNNPGITKNDPRVPPRGRRSLNIPWEFAAGVGGGLVLVGLFIFIMIQRRKRVLDMAMSAVTGVISTQLPSQPERPSLPSASISGLPIPPQPHPQPPPSQVIDYIRDCRRQGMVDDEIRQQLSKSGWPIEIIDRAMRS